MAIKKVAAKKKKLRPNLAKTIEDLQSQADEITTTTFIPGLPESLKAMKSFDEIKPLTDINLGYSMVKDYTVLIDCMAAVSLSTGFICFGIYLGRIL